MSNTQLEPLLAGEPADVQAEILHINEQARDRSLQVALLVPVLASLLGLINGFPIRRLPDPPRRPPPKRWSRPDVGSRQSPRLRTRPREDEPVRRFVPILQWLPRAPAALRRRGASRWPRATPAKGGPQAKDAASLLISLVICRHVTLRRRIPRRVTRCPRQEPNLRTPVEETAARSADAQSPTRPRAAAEGKAASYGRVAYGERTALFPQGAVRYSCCSTETAYLQAYSVCCSSLQPTRVDS